MRSTFRKNRGLIILLLDILVIILGYVLSVAFLNQTDELDLILLLKGIAINLLVYQAFLNIFGLYQNMIEYEVGKDYIKYIFVSVISIILITIFSLIFKLAYVSFKINVLTGIFISGMLIVYRLFLRSVFTSNRKIINNKKNITSKNNLLIIGAGMGAREIIISILNNRSDKYNIVGLIDDDKSKIGHKILGIKVLGTRYDIPRIAKENDIDLIFFAINRIDPLSRKEILNICQETNVKTRVLPTTESVIDKQGALNSLRDVEIEDLLGREPIYLENKNIRNIIKNKVVLVTGGGGSIGSELCRQIAKYNPKKFTFGSR